MKILSSHDSKVLEVWNLYHHQPEKKQNFLLCEWIVQSTEQMKYFGSGAVSDPIYVHAVAYRLTHAFTYFLIFSVTGLFTDMNTRVGLHIELSSVDED